MDTSELNICRTCLNENSNLYPLFITTSSDQEDLNFAIMLMSCTSVNIECNDKMPHYICEECINLLNTAYNFKKQCENSDLLLRERIHGILYTEDDDRSCNRNAELEVDQVEESGCKLAVTDHDNSDQDVMRELFKCDLCDKTFKSIGRLLSHKKKHGHKCGTCSAVFGSKRDLLRHRKIHPYIYKCSLCDKLFASPYGLNYHLKLHNGTRNYVCPVAGCNKSFLWKQTLEKHLPLHSTQKNHLCYLCGKAYSAYDSLRYHLKDHKGQRPHTCDHCGKTFKQACHLKCHMWLHTGIKPYVCKFCSRRYTRSFHLKTHMNKYCGIGKIPPISNNIQIEENVNL